jgi:hypothetical protein
VWAPHGALHPSPRQRRRHNRRNLPHSAFLRHGMAVILAVRAVAISGLGGLFGARSAAPLSVVPAAVPRIGSSAAKARSGSKRRTLPTLMTLLQLTLSRSCRYDADLDTTGPVGGPQARRGDGQA